jgi:hypothetical protein
MSDETEWKTIRVPKDVYQDAKARKEEHSVTWGEYVNPHAWHSVFDAPSDAPTGEVESTTDVDSDEIARKVAERLEGSKPLAEMEFEDWFEPDYAKTIATHIESEIMLSDVGVDYTPVLNRIDDLESQLPAKVAEELR